MSAAPTTLQQQPIALLLDPARLHSRASRTISHARCATTQLTRYPPAAPPHALSCMRQRAHELASCDCAPSSCAYRAPIPSRVPLQASSDARRA
eukprot:351777-Prymnesium_polylepis.1